MEEIGRKHPVHQSVHERRDVPIIVYLTVCTKRRKPILATPAVHELLRASWREARLWLVGRYVIMPDHLHLFCAPPINYGGMSSVSSQTSRSEVASLDDTAVVPPVRSRSGSHFGNLRVHDIGQIRTTLRSGSAISGIRSCAGAKVTIKRGVCCGKSGSCRPGEACMRLAISRGDERAAVVFLNFGTTRTNSRALIPKDTRVLCGRPSKTSSFDIRRFNC